MSVLINLKICEEAPDCDGIAICPTHALSYNNDTKSIVIDNTKCISCGLCMPLCPVSAIYVAKNQEEYEDYKKQIADDPRTIKDLFVDRYGASAVTDFFLINQEQLQDKIDYIGITIIEIYDASKTLCLLRSIPIRDITDEINGDVRYYKLDSSQEVQDKYKVSQLPSLLIFKAGNEIGRVEGCYTQEQKDEFLEKIKSILV